MRLDNGDLGYTVQHCSLETHQADSPGSEYHRVLYRVSGQPEAHYVYPVSQRLRECPDAGACTFGERINVLCRGTHVVGETAGGMDADQGPIRAEVGIPGATQTASPVRGERVDRRDVPHQPFVHALADLDHDPGELVPHN
jgi:hypothetical protein